MIDDVMNVDVTTEIMPASHSPLIAGPIHAIRECWRRIEKNEITKSVSRSSTDNPVIRRPTFVITMLVNKHQKMNSKIT